MTSLVAHPSCDSGEKSNITTRRGSGHKSSNMATKLKKCTDLDVGSCPLIESILSQDETKDIVTMMMQADEIEDDSCHHSFCTSTQMGGRIPRYPSTSPVLSPLGPQGHRRCLDLNSTKETSDQEDSECTITKNVQDMNAKNMFNDSIEFENESGTSDALDEKENQNVVNSPSCVTKPRRPGFDDVTVGVVDVTDYDRRPASMESNVVTKGLSDVTAEWELGGDGSADPNDEGTEESAKAVVVGERPSSGEGEDEEPEEGDSQEEEKDGVNPLTPPDLAAVASKLGIVEEILLRLDSRTTRIDDTVKDLQTSLEYSQSEIDLLKKENADLKQKLGSIDTEDKRTQFQMNVLEDKLDRIETSTKKKNLIIEGISEVDGRKEDLEKTVGEVLDQLAIQKSINFEACYRVGPFNKHRTRPILVSFEKQVDRDMVYAKRMDLKNTRSFHKVWINEDLGPLSKKKRGLIRLISREAQLQGIDCRTGKYAIHIDRKKFDHDNLDDLPPPLHPANLKQVQLDANTIAYQSEFAPFSNFFPCTMVVGKHTFFLPRASIPVSPC